VRWEYFGTGLASLGIGITMVLALPPPWWPSMPHWMVRSGLFFGLALIVYGVSFTAMGIWPDALRPRLWPIVSLSFGLSVVVASVVWMFLVTPPEPAVPHTKLQSVQPDIIILPPRNKFFVRWNPPSDLFPNTRIINLPSLPQLKINFPAFLLKNLGTAVAYDVSFWHRRCH
jgi:hypothetical protein